MRRLALKYKIEIGDQPDFQRKPGVWDPLVGLAWHRVGEKLEVHAMFEGGGFGVGTDVELSGGLRLDWKPFEHFGFTGGYNFLYFKLSNTLDRAGVHRQADDARPSRRCRDLFLIPSSCQQPQPLAALPADHESLRQRLGEPGLADARLSPLDRIRGSDRFRSPWSPAS